MSGILIHAVNFLVLISFLIWVARKKMKESYQKQHEEFQAKLQEASAQYEATKQAYEKLKADFEQLDSRLAEMRRLSLREVENESQRIESETNRQIQNIIQDGETRIKNEAEKLKANLELELLDRSLDAAKKAIATQMPNQDQEWIAQMVGNGSAMNTTGRKNYAS